MKALVYKVELTEKKRVTVELETLSLTSHAQIFELKSNLGAAVRVNANNYTTLAWDADIQRAPGMRKVRVAKVAQEAAT